ncbi:glycosyltransferase [methane-oxidizing endosymbiont of Gigantopelta aegis]|uniref:glycosyltransferase n=1 Tax=methane-oxidizing endosymbiont of Gigantopelta aegis TaxID=2794938 RepID=UPI0018DE52C7|nr:glycosyltransferase [methane-oxidizing endosymbiont of Gigantopelta aegis]
MNFKGIFKTATAPSIIICSYNRCQNLPDCFSCLEKQVITDPIQWEVLLVDNNSTDNTKQVTEDFNQSSSLNIRYIFEQKQGLSYARNRGINEAKGTYLMFIDDDIRVTENWLQSIYSTFKQYDCDAVGGRIHIESPNKLPPWITPDMYVFWDTRTLEQSFIKWTASKSFHLVAIWLFTAALLI